MNEVPVLLYVDDEPINIMLFEMNFQRIFNLVTAASGAEALEKLRLHSSIKVVISDMKMPEMNGLEFISIAKKEFPQPVYLILTGYHVSEEISKAIENKTILKCLGKPFDAPEIEAIVNNALD